MAEFELCEDCKREFVDPLDRRFHAQPNACPVCGPALFYQNKLGKIDTDDPLARAKADLAAGKIIAVKGIGGYHLACDAKNEQAVQTLRSRKHRWDKPFALMMPDMDTISKYCYCNEDESALLQSQRRPIVLLQKKNRGEQLASAIAPGNGNLGVMLPYAPLHYLLIEGYEALVMTSANYSDEPIIYRDDQALALLKEQDQGKSSLADAVLGHNRKIFRRCDDSVMMLVLGKKLFLRRSRGYAPEPLPIDDCGQSILSLGGEQKNTFCLTRKKQAFISQHIGDLDNLPTYNSYAQEIQYFQRMFNSTPQIIAHDLHPSVFIYQICGRRDRG